MVGVREGTVPVTYGLTIALNDRPLRRPKTGVGHYIQELMRWLPVVAPQHAYLGFVSQLPGYRQSLRGQEPGPEAAEDGERTPPRRLPWWMRRLAQGTYDAAFRIATRVRHCDVYHEPNNIAIPSHVPTVTTVHDMSVVRHPEWHPSDRVAWYKRNFDASIRRTRHCICPSDFTKRELVSLAGVEPESITVIPLAPRATFRPQSQEAVAAWRARVGLPNPYFLFVGTFEPRKNIETVLAAYSKLPPAVRHRYPLVLAGPSGWGMTSLDQRASELGIKSSVVPLGYVSDGELAVAYSAARALVWPSWYEGFGLPPLECMACGTPVITSNVASLPEVVGDAAILVDPADADSLTTAMERIADDTKVAEDLAGRGVARAAQFTWRRCTEAHVGVYEACAGPGG